MHVAIINGPNLNMLGTRQPETYGGFSLHDLHDMCKTWGDSLNLNVECYQSNHEGDIVSHIQSMYQKADALIINAGAYTHTSVAIRDAILAVDIPIYEVHISNILARDTFRHHSYLSDIAVGVICGFGIQGYYYALQQVAHT